MKEHWSLDERSRVLALGKKAIEFWDWLSLGTENQRKSSDAALKRMAERPFILRPPFAQYSHENGKERLLLPGNSYDIEICRVVDDPDSTHIIRTSSFLSVSDQLERSLEDYFFDEDGVFRMTKKIQRWPKGHMLQSQEFCIEDMSSVESIGIPVGETEVLVEAIKVGSFDTKTLIGQVQASIERNS